MFETNRIEYKSQLTDNLEKEVVSFVNYRDGGIIYIGVDDNGKPIGLQNLDTLQLKIKDRIKNNISPSTMGLFDVLIETIDDKNIIKINVASGLEKPYFIKKKGMSSKGCFLRVGSASEPMPQQMIDKLFAGRIRNSIGNIKSRNQELTFEQLKIYYNNVGLNLGDKFHKNLELLTVNNELNYAAYLLADKNGCSIKVAKYAGLDRTVLLENDEYGYCSMVQATKSVLQRIKIENKTFAKITDAERQEISLLNPIAIREAIVNAIIHNDFSNETSPKFEIFDDRLEITSSGGLPPSFSKEEFFLGYSVPQNKELMRVFKDLDLVESLGSGIPRILETYDESIYLFTQNFIRIVFPFENGFVSKKKIEKKVNTQDTMQANTQDTTQASQATTEDGSQANEVLEYCIKAHSREDIQKHLGLKHIEYMRKSILKPLILAGKLMLTIPDKPTSKKQKYYTNPSIFGKVNIKATTQDTTQANTQDTMQANLETSEQEKNILEYCSLEVRSRDEIQYNLGLKNRENFRKNILKPLILNHKLLLTIPDKPTSPNQKYYSAGQK